MSERLPKKYKLSRAELESYFINPVLYIISIGVLGFIIAMASDDVYAFPLVAIGISLVYISHTHNELKEAHKARLKAQELDDLMRREDDADEI